MQQVVEHLAKILGLATTDAEFHSESVEPRADAVVELAGHTFVIEWKGSGAAALVANAAEQVRRFASTLGARAIPLVAVPFMGAVGRERCEEADVAWLDLSGNARIFAPGLNVRIEGQPNRFKRLGRPSSVFAPKSSRIARWLLMHPDRPVTQREIAKVTDMDEGFTSRIVSRLQEDDLIVRDSDGAIRPRDPSLLLDAWRGDYDFSKHRIQRGHIPARSGDALLHQLAEEFRKQSLQYAATGLAAAWLLTKFAGFRIVTIYLYEHPAHQLHERLGFREGARGSNVWLVVPNDEGVFHGATDLDEVHCVHPVQVYLDLQAHPERASEAADKLRTDLLNGRPNA